jgi:nicotinamidase-related amidase
MEAKRHPHYSCADRTVLVVIDAQERLAKAMEPAVWSRTERGIAVLLAAARRLGIPVIVTEQYPQGLGPTTAALLAALGDHQRVEKVEFDACAAAGFWAHVPQSRQFVLAGMETHICVLQTALGLLAARRRIWVAADATCSRREESWRAGLDLVRGAGGVVAPVETLLFMWLERAGTAEFKELSKLVR